MTNYYKSIKQLRTQKNISQEEICRKINVSRSSYIAFEQGKKDLSFSQMIKLSNMLGVSLESIKNNMIPNMEKYKEMVLFILRQLKNKDEKIPKTKLAKMLYLADFSWFYYELKSMSNMLYSKLQFGPVPETFFRALEELEQDGKIVTDKKKEGVFLIKESESNKNQKINLLNNKEKELIKKITKKWESKKTQEVVNFTHNQLPYLLCHDKEIIPYELITQEEENNIY